MTEHKVVSRAEWQTAQDELLRREKEHTRLGDELARQRRELPWVEIEETYLFDTDDGPRTLARLFDGHSQLMFYHFMFGPSYEAGCPVNSLIADGLDSLLPHLHARDVTLLLVSRARSPSSRPISAGWAGTSLGSRRRTPASTTTRAPPIARRRCGHGASMRTACRRS